MYCSICVEVCPFDALHWSPEFEYAELDIRELTHEKERLREWMWTVPTPAALDEGAEPAKEITLRRRPRSGRTADAVTVVEVLFLLLGLVAVGSALLVVTTRTMVHAALWLVVTLGAVAGIFLLLAAEFVAWVQILIYVGAVVVLLLFALMLTKAPTGPQPDLDARRALPAVAVAGLVLAVLGTTVVAGFHGVELDLDGAVVGSRRPPATRSSSSGCCRSRCSACCCSPPSSGRSCSRDRPPGR